MEQPNTIPNFVTLKAPNVKIDEFAHRVDPDEVVHLDYPVCPIILNILNIKLE